jgi:prepilin-type N-terminal cleavage/methylation domain-containing protein
MKIENYKLKISRGFTLIELLIVISIIGILATALLSMINPGQQQRKAKMSALRSDLTKIAKGAEAYAANFGTYSRVDANGNPNYGYSSGGNCWSWWSGQGYAKGPYPQDPNGNNYDIRCDRTYFCIDGVTPNLSGTNETWRYHSNDGQIRENLAC